MANRRARRFYFPGLDYRIDIPRHMLTMASTDRGRSAFDTQVRLDCFLEPDLCGMEIGLVNGAAFVTHPVLGTDNWMKANTQLPRSRLPGS